MLVPLSYNLRSLFVRKSATLLTVLGIGATVAIVSGVLALQQGFRTMFTTGGRDDVVLFLRPGANSEGDSQFSRDRGLKLIKRVPEIAVGPHGPIASMEAYLAVLLSPSRGGVTNVPLRGVQPMTFAIREDELAIVDHVRSPPGGWFAPSDDYEEWCASLPIAPGSDELIVGSRLVGRIEHCAVGEEIVLNRTPFRVVGVFEHDGQFGGEIWGDLDRMLAAMGRYGPNRVVAQMKPDTEVGAPDPMVAFRTKDPEQGIEDIVNAAVLPWYAKLPVVGSRPSWKAVKAESKATVNRLLAGRTDWRELCDVPEDDIASRLALGARSPAISHEIREYLAKARVKLDPVPGSLADRLRTDPEVPAKVFSEKKFLESQTVMLTFMLVGLSAALGLIMGCAAVFTATNTMLSAIAARTHEIGVLLAMGYRPIPIFLSFMFEALVLGAIGGLAGCLMALPFNGVKAGTMNFQTFTEMAFAFRVTPVVLSVAIFFSLLLGLFGGALPAWRAARMRPTVALRQG